LPKAVIYPDSVITDNTSVSVGSILLHIKVEAAKDNTQSVKEETVDYAMPTGLPRQMLFE